MPFTPMSAHTRFWQQSSADWQEPPALPQTPAPPAPPLPLVPPVPPVCGASQRPVKEPRATPQVVPAQQSPVVVQIPPAATQVGPVGDLGWQRSTPLESGKQGVPAQHSEEKAHCWPVAMQHGATPV